MAESKPQKLRARIAPGRLADREARAVSPALDLVLANLELMPHSLNIRKGAKIGQRQVDLARKLHAAGMLSAGELEAVIERGRATVGKVPDAPADGY